MEIRFHTDWLIFGFILAVLLVALGLMFLPTKPVPAAGSAALQTQQTTTQTITMPSFSKMKMTEFDIQLAKKNMDADNDGRCDACGMPVEMCIDAGELQCAMDPNSKLGKLGSQHIHADWKIYINGKEFDFSVIADRHEKQMHGDTSIKDTSAFIHIHPEQAPEKGGDALHVHATGIPLWIFFDSLNIKLPNSTKVYVNGTPNSDGLNYVPKGLDKILITDSDNQSEIEAQMKTITDFARAHS